MNGTVWMRNEATLPPLPRTLALRIQAALLRTLPPRDDRPLSCRGGALTRTNLLFLPSVIVGGFMEPVNKRAVFAPYLVVGLAVLVIVAVKPWKREN
ncbi:MAG: hypothetical protein ABSG74_12540 [Candidatus Bathyarchaeia archaeon]